MSILDKARKAISDRKQVEAEKAAAEQSALDYQAENSQSRATKFVALLELPRAFKTTIEGGVITIRHKGKIVVEITFGWNTSPIYEGGDYACESPPFATCWIKYHTEWLPDGGQEYQRKSTGADTFYPDHKDSQNELGEYLLRVMHNQLETTT